MFWKIPFLIPIAIYACRCIYQNKKKINKTHWLYLVKRNQCNFIVTKCNLKLPTCSLLGLWFVCRSADIIEKYANVIFSFDLNRAHNRLCRQTWRNDADNRSIVQETETTSCINHRIWYFRLPAEIPTRKLLIISNNFGYNFRFYIELHSLLSNDGRCTQCSVMSNDYLQKKKIAKNNRVISRCVVR